MKKAFQLVRIPSSPPSTITFAPQELRYTAAMASAVGSSEAARVGARVVIVDSIQATGKGALGKARAVQVWAQSHGGVGIIVSHENKQGKVFGSSGLGYYLDATLRVTSAGKKARVRVLKSRAGPVGQALTELVNGKFGGEP